MDRRLALQQLLENLLGSDNVYFQPPSTVKINYPCIIFKLNDVDTNFADDIPYISRKGYQVTVIDSNPDSLIPDKIGALPSCKFDRSYTADNLNHKVYSLYY